MNNFLQVFGERLLERWDGTLERGYESHFQSCGYILPYRPNIHLFVDGENDPEIIINIRMVEDKDVFLRNIPHFTSAVGYEPKMPGLHHIQNYSIIIKEGSDNFSVKSGNNPDVSFLTLGEIFDDIAFTIDSKVPGLEKLGANANLKF